MRRDRFWLSWVCVCVFVLAGAPAPAAAQEDEEKPPPLAERPVLRVNPLTSGFQFDGRPGDPAWSAATDSIAALTMVEPDEGSEASESTAGDAIVDCGLRIADWKSHFDPFSAVP